MRYNHPIMKKKISNLLGSLSRVVVAFVLLVGELLIRVVSLFASCAITPDTNEASSNAARGGVLNYRTGKFDEGTDANGWYEKD